jgi:hypothetical protein
MEARRWWWVLIVLLGAIGLAAPPAAAQTAGRFRPLRVYVDSATRQLAAYQVEVAVQKGRAQVVGVEGGDHLAFRAAPYYDPAALHGGRIIIAAFHTGRDLPTGRTRVATIHMRETGAKSVEYRAKLITAGSADGAAIPATVSVETDGGGGT